MFVLMTLVIPKFKEVFQGLAEGAQLPAFTRFVMACSDLVKDHIVWTAAGVAAFVVLFMLFKSTKFGRHVWDKFKLKMPVVGPVISKSPSPASPAPSAPSSAAVSPSSRP